MIFLISCNKNKEIPSAEITNNTVNEDNSQFKYNDFAEDFATEIVSLLSRTNKKHTDSEFLKFIIEKCNLRFDGDDNFLIKDYLYEKIGEDKVFIEYFNELTQRNLLKAIEIEPKMQIAVYLIEKVDLFNPNIGGVVYLRNDTDEEKEKYVNSINMVGEHTWLSSSKEPEIPYIIISFNERVDGKGRVNKLNYSLDEFSKLKNLDASINHNNRIMNCDFQFVDQTATLDASDIIEVKQYKLLDMKEAWHKKGPDVRMRHISQSGVIINTVHDDPKRKDAKNKKWVEIDKQTFSYQPNAHGEDFYVTVWFEDDGGSNDTYDFSFQNVTMADGTTSTLMFSTNITKNDDIYGEALIPIDDPSGTCYQANDAIFIKQFD